MAHDPFDTSDYVVPIEPREVAKALRELGDGKSDYLGRLMLVAAWHTDAFSRCKSSQSDLHLKEAAALAGNKS